MNYIKDHMHGAACDGSMLQSKQIARFGYRIGWLRRQLVIQSKHALYVFTGVSTQPRGENVSVQRLADVVVHRQHML